VAAWFWYAVIAAILYGAHQIFTRLAAERIGEGLGGFAVEARAALSILIYLGFLWFGGRWS
jgi:transporter family protein